MIQLNNVAFSYLPGERIFSQVNMRLEKGSFTFIAGSSGAGKSSLLQLLALAQAPTEGSIELFGKKSGGLSRKALPHVRRKIGTVFQDYRLLEHLSIAENVGLPLKVSGEKVEVIEKKVDELLQWVGLETVGNRRPSLLSGGQKQRAAIARAVINNPPLLLADEPTGNLDAALSKRIMHLFETLNANGTTIVFATHDEHLLSHYDHAVLYVRDGKVTRTNRASGR